MQPSIIHSKRGPDDAAPNDTSIERQHHHEQQEDHEGISTGKNGRAREEELRAKEEGDNLTLDKNGVGVVQQTQTDPVEQVRAQQQTSKNELADEGGGDDGERRRDDNQSAVLLQHQDQHVKLDIQESRQRQYLEGTNLKYYLDQNSNSNNPNTHHLHPQDDDIQDFPGPTEDTVTTGVAAPLPPALARQNNPNGTTRRQQASHPGAYPTFPFGHREQDDTDNNHLDIAAPTTASQDTPQRPDDDMPLIEATLVQPQQQQEPPSSPPRPPTDGDNNNDTNNINIPQAEIVQFSFHNYWKVASTRGKLVCIGAVLIFGSLAITGIVCGTSGVCADAEGGDYELPPASDPPVASANYSLPKYTLQIVEKDPDSVQSKAHEWLVSNYNQTILEDMPFWRRDQLFVLSCLYFAFENIDNGDDEQHNFRTSPKEYTFDASIPECDWATTSCNEEGKIVSFRFTQSTTQTPIVGIIPREIELLNSLESLGITFCNLQGNLGEILPPQIQNLQNLKELSLMENQITGTIPDFIHANMTQLTVLSFKNNLLTGPIHSNLMLSMTNLQVLELNRNDLSSTIPGGMQLSNISTLQTLALNLNPLLVGSIPTEVGLLTNMQTLYLNECSLTGTLPSQLGLLTELNWFRGQDNSFTGSFPSQLGLLTKLLNLRLHSNPITGQIPSEFGMLQQLTSLSMRQMILEGTIPTELGRMASVGHLNLQDSTMNGTLPSQLGLCTNLHKLVLGYGLTGEVPKEICELTIRDDKPVLLTIDCETMEPCPDQCQCKCVQG